MKKFFFLLFAIIVVSLPSQAEIIKISANDAVKLALQHNLALQAKRKEIAVLEQEVKMANALKNPQLQSTILMGPVGKTNASQAGIAIPLEISKRGVRKKAAIANMKLIENQIRQEELNLKLEVMEAYFDVVYMKSVVAILQQREELFKNMKLLAENKPKNSKNYEIEKLQSDIKYKKQLVSLNKAKANLLYSQFNFNKILNLKDTDVMYDTRENSLFQDHISLLDIQLPEYETIEEVAMKYSYSIRIAYDNIDKSEKELAVARHKVIPDITVIGGYAFSGDGMLHGGYAGGYLDLPVFYSYRPEVNRAKIILERAKIDKVSFENKLKFALKEDYNQFKYAKENMGYYKDILKESDKILKMSEQRYAKGDTQLLNLFIIENSHQEILNEYISAMQVYYNAYLDLIHNMGHDILLDEDSLEDL
ncbi:glr3618 protein [Clostridium sp. CAG:768]|nr:glr3618 protein [Clostridium sp. CAG:768]